MAFLTGKEEIEARKYFSLAANEAAQSTCLRRKCGSVIVKDGEVIGKGHNSPPGDLESQRRCLSLKKEYDEKITDKTCCVHAEQRAIMDALAKNSGSLEDATLYFVSVNEHNAIEYAGKPYCTICSKMTLDARIKNFALWHEEGMVVYDSEKYNDLSFAFRQD